MANPEMTYSYIRIAQYCDQMAKHMLNNKLQFDTIVAIARGGLVPAGMLAPMIGVRRVHTVCVSSYGADRKKAYISSVDVLGGLSELRQKCDGPKTLIVDDIADTGETMKLVRELLPRAQAVTVICKSDGRPYVNGYADLISQEVWVKFPWERDTKTN